MADAPARRIDAILVWKLDRFGRSLKHLVNVLAELEALGVAFISLQDSLDFATPVGRAMVGMLAVMAEFERDTIRERVCASLRHAKAKGRRLGRPPRTLSRQQVRKARELRRQGVSWQAVAKRVRVPAPTLFKKLRSVNG